MPIILPNGLTPQEIRVLQEFTRLKTGTLTVDAVKAIRHPADVGGEAPAVSLVAKGYLTSTGEGFEPTDKGRAFMAIQAAPDGEPPAPKPAKPASPAAAAAEPGPAEPASGDA